MEVDDAFVRALHAAAQWFLLALAVLLTIAVVRGLTAFVHRLRARGRILPLILVPGDPDQAADGTPGPPARLVSHLAAHLTEHGGESVLAPGSPSTATADSRPQTSDPAQGWVESVLRIALSSPPGYAVHLDELEPVGTTRRVSVRIVRVPRNRIIAATVISEEDEERLLERIAVHCVAKVRSQPEMLRRIPRWERWGAGEQALAHYREGMYQQRTQTRPRAGDESLGGEYARALRAFDQAVEFAPGNLLVRHAQAALIELMHADDPEQYQRAIKIYQRCTRLWSEHIETAYRMAIAYSRAARPQPPDPGLTPEEAERLRAAMAVLAREHLSDICRRLRLAPLLRRWLRSSIPGGRSNSGERRYWGSWLLPLPLPARRSQRRTFLGAIRIALAAHELTEIQRGGGPAASAEEQRAQRRTVSRAFDQVAREVLVRTWYPRRGTGLRRLLFDDHTMRRSAHDADRHGVVVSRARATSRHWGPERKGATGWMTHYNAACFLSLAMKLPRACLPEGFTAEQWREDCGRSALDQLDRSMRTHDSTLTGDWIAHDPDLDALWEPGGPGAEWAEFMNVDPPARGAARP